MWWNLAINLSSRALRAKLVLLLDILGVCNLPTSIFRSLPWRAMPVHLLSHVVLRTKLQAPLSELLHFHFDRHIFIEISMWWDFFSCAQEEAWFIATLGPNFELPYLLVGASLVAQIVKNLPAMWETPVRSLDRDNPLGMGMATHSNFLAWRIPWTEEPGEL